MGTPKAVSVMGSLRGCWQALGREHLGAVGRITFDVGGSRRWCALRGASSSCTSWAANEGLSETRILGTKGRAYMSPLRVFKELHGSLVDIAPTSIGR